MELLKFLLNNLFLSAVILNIGIYAKDKDNGIKLTSPILAVIDGLPGILDEHTIHKTLYVRQELMRLQFGILDKKTKERKPQHMFQGKAYTLGGLVKLEKNNPSLREELNKLLYKIREEFIIITDPFVAESKGTKQQMMILITESCKKRKRMNSLLLNWHEDNEKESLIKNATSFKIFDQFCTDLSNFLKDLVISCPKAFHKFKEWQAKQNK